MVGGVQPKTPWVTSGSDPSHGPHCDPWALGCPPAWLCVLIAPAMGAALVGMGVGGRLVGCFAGGVGCT